MPTPRDGSSFSTGPRSRDAAPAASCRSWAPSRLPPNGTCGRAASILRRPPTSGRTLRASSATAPSPSNTRPPPGSTEADRARLLATAMAGLCRCGEARRPDARASIRRPVARAAHGNPRKLRHARRGRRLRGCIGSATPRRPLIEDVVTNAVNAGFSDPRFAPLTETELEGLQIEVSILSHPRELPAANEAQLVCCARAGPRRPNSRRRPAAGAVLPGVWRQVADGGEFVRHLLAKAGIDRRKLAGRPRGPALPGRVLRRAVAIGEFGRRSRRRASRRRLRCIEKDARRKALGGRRLRIVQTGTRRHASLTARRLQRMDRSGKSERGAFDPQSPAPDSALRAERRLARADDDAHLGARLQTKRAVVPCQVACAGSALGARKAMTGVADEEAIVFPLRVGRARPELALQSQRRTLNCPARCTIIGFP